MHFTNNKEKEGAHSGYSHANFLLIWQKCPGLYSGAGDCKIGHRLSTGM